MTYRIKPSEKKYKKRKNKPLVLASRNMPRKRSGRSDYDKIDMGALFGQRALKGRSESAFALWMKRIKGSSRHFFARVKIKTRRALFYAAVAFRALLRGLGRFLTAFFGAVRAYAEKKRARRCGPSEIAMLSGALCGVVLVGVLSAFLVLYKLILADYFGSYVSVTLPDTVGKSFSVAEESLPEKYYNVNVSYEYSKSVPQGCVISQSPSAGAVRKIYSNKEACTVSLTLSRGKQLTPMPDFSGTRARDAELELRNAGFDVVRVDEYSDTDAVGDVIYTSPSAGESIEAGGLAILYVSLGQRVTNVRVPNVCALSESEATNKLLSVGLSVGRISYQSSQKPAGTVLSQSPSAGGRVKKGTSVSLVISAGESYADKTVPSLYGLTLNEARQRLSEYGLVAGNIYAVDSREPSGTVVSQSPAAGEAIEPGLVGVDMYVSS